MAVSIGSWLYLCILRRGWHFFSTQIDNSSLLGMLHQNESRKMPQSWRTPTVRWADSLERDGNLMSTRISWSTASHTTRLTSLCFESNPLGWSTSKICDIWDSQLLLPSWVLPIKYLNLKSNTVCRGSLKIWWIKVQSTLCLSTLHLRTSRRCFTFPPWSGRWLFPPQPTLAALASWDVLFKDWGRLLTLDWDE